MAAGESEGSESKRRRILDAAFEVSAERGVHAARMEEVAARAQVSKGTLYRFFGNKEDLFLEMIIESYRMGRLASGMDDEIAPSVGPAEELRRRLDGLAKVLDVVAPRSRVHYQAFGVVGDSKEASIRLDQFLTEFHRDRHEEFEGLVREGQEQGVFRPGVDPAMVSNMMGSLLSGFVYQASFDPSAATPEALRACFESLFRDVLGFESDARPSGEGSGD